MMRGALPGIVVAIICVTGVILLVWSAFSFASHALFLSRHGVQKSARVLNFHSVTTGRGGSTFYYFVEIDGVPREHGFRHKLREGSVIPLLASPSDPNDFEIGRVGDSAFDVFAHQIGSRVFAYIFLVFYPFFFFVLLPISVWALWREHQKGGGLFRPAQRNII
jgi:hypothetical protein